MSTILIVILIEILVTLVIIAVLGLLFMAWLFGYWPFDDDKT